MGVGGDKGGLCVGGEVGDEVEVIALMGREVTALAGGEV